MVRTTTEMFDLIRQTKSISHQTKCSQTLAFILHFLSFVPLMRPLKARSGSHADAPTPTPPFSPNFFIPLEQQSVAAILGPHGSDLRHQACWACQAAPRWGKAQVDLGFGRLARVASLALRVELFIGSCPPLASSTARSDHGPWLVYTSYSFFSQQSKHCL